MSGVDLNGPINPPSPPPRKSKSKLEPDWSKLVVSPVVDQRLSPSSFIARNPSSKKEVVGNHIIAAPAEENSE